MARTAKAAKATKTKETKGKETNWPDRVERGKRALDLEPGLYEKGARIIAHTLKVAAEESTARKGTPLQSAMGALNFMLNRRGKSMPEEQRKRLERAKIELRRLFASQSP